MLPEIPSFVLFIQTERTVLESLLLCLELLCNELRHAIGKEVNVNEREDV